MLIAALLVLASAQPQPDYRVGDVDLSEVIDTAQPDVVQGLQRAGARGDTPGLSIIAVLREHQYPGGLWETLTDDFGAAVAVADWRRSRTISLAGHDGWLVPTDPTWHEDPFGDPSWVLQYQSLAWLQTAWVAGDRRAVATLVMDWIKDNPVSAGGAAWGDHAIAYRTDTLVKLLAEGLASELEPRDLASLVNVLYQQGVALRRFLDDPAWVGHNHNLFHALSLFNLAVAIPQLAHADEWRSRAHQRVNELLSEMVDPIEGISAEQSIAYHFVALDLFVTARDLEHGVPVRIALVANIYPDATHPALGTFVKSRVEALRAAGATVDVVATRGWVPHNRVLGKYALLGSRAAARALIAHLKRLRYDVVESHIAYPTGTIALPLARLLGAKLVLFAHGADVFEVASRNRLHLRVASALFAAADLLVANSRFTHDHILAKLGVPPSKVLIASPGIDLVTFRERPSDHRPPRQGILYVGRLDPEKGVGVLMRALAESPPALFNEQLTIVGWGRDAERLREEADHLGLKARFLGARPPAEVAAEMQRALVTVVPSICQESLGLVAIEAMAAGSLVVATTVGGLCETVREGETGFSCRPGDPRDLAAALARAYHAAQDQARYDAIRRQALLVATEHDRIRAAEITLKAYGRLVRSGSAQA